MQRVAVFGNAGAGKSALARKLAGLTGLPLFVIDEMQFRPGGDPVPQDEFLTAHAALLRQDRWIIDGYGTAASSFERFARADTLVHVDPPLPVLYWRVTKRLLKGLVAPVPGWPERSPLWSSSLSSYKVIPACHRAMTPKYRQVIADGASSKRVHRLTSRADMAAFMEAVRRETNAANRDGG